MRWAGLLVVVGGCWMGSAPPTTATTPTSGVEAGRSAPAAREPATDAPALASPVSSKVGPDADALARGRRLYETAGCVACHTIDGSSRIGPSWKGMWGRAETLSAPRAPDTSSPRSAGPPAPTLVVDAAYIRRSILDPSTEVVAGYPPAMPSFSGQLSEADIGDIIAFVRSLK